MGYGLGIFLIAVGLILALAIDATLIGIDIEMIGWILAGAGLLVLLVTAVQLNTGRGSRSTAVPRRRYEGGGNSSGGYGGGSRYQGGQETQDRPPYA